MMRIKIKLKKSTKNYNEGRIYYQIIHNKYTQELKTDYKIFFDEWSPAISKIIFDNTLDEERVIYLNNIKTRIKMDLKRFECINQSFYHDNYTIDDILSKFSKTHKGKTLFNFTLDTICRYNKLGKVRTAETYTSTLSSFIAYRKGEDIPLSLIDSEIIEAYEAFLKQKEISLNTISFYLKRLRAIYNKAVESNLISSQNPFKRAYTSIEKTNKRAITLRQIKKIKELDLSSDSKVEFARDVFLFSFYTRGMSFIDIAYLKKKDLKNGELNYMRRKTSQRLQIKWEKCMQDIVGKHNNINSEYMFPIITSKHQHRKQYIDSMSTINRLLKKVVHYADIECNLTMYVARHSWASIAKSKNIPISVISEGMGHDSEKTTQIYLASLESSVIDKANRLIINSI